MDCLINLKFNRIFLDKFLQFKFQIFITMSLIIDLKLKGFKFCDYLLHFFVTINVK